MPSHTVTAEPVDTGRKDEHGNTIWSLSVDGYDSTIVLHKKHGNKPPAAGSVVNGNVKEGRLFLDKPSPNGAGGRGKKDDKDFDRRPDHPLNTARTLHTSALSSAPAYVAQMIEFGVEDKPGNGDEYWELVADVVGKLKSTYPAAVKDWAKGTTDGAA